MIRGNKKNWEVIDLIGKGDAGEVLRVRSELVREPGLMKRPVQNVSGGTILRQAIQIENEGGVLERLNGLNSVHQDLTIHTPLLMDKSIIGTSQTAGYFIVSEEAKGVAISTLLKQHYHEKISLSHILVLKVIYGLFLLLENIHEHGIVWNDVKMDHIFWDEASNTLSFIDWGNSILFDRNNNSDVKTKTLTDYEQLFKEGGVLLQQIAPELIEEIDWPSPQTPFVPANLPHLVHRIKYIESHFSMRVIEYQVAFTKSLKNLSDLPTIKRVLEIKSSLTGLGIPTDIGTLSQGVTDFALSLAQKKDAKSLSRMISIVRHSLPEIYTGKLQIVELLIKTQQSEHLDSFWECLHNALKSDWSQAFWSFQKSTAESQLSMSYSQAIMAMRKAAIGIDENVPLLIEQVKSATQDLATFQKEINSRYKSPEPSTIHDSQNLSSELHYLIDHWYELENGEMLGDKFLRLRDLIGGQSSVWPNLSPELSLTVNTILAKTRQIYLSWTEGNLVETKNSIMELNIFEPSLKYLRKIHSDIEDLEKWMVELTEGPLPEQSITEFARVLKSKETLIASQLSRPAWLNSLYTCVDTLLEAIDLETLRDLPQLKDWPIPWIDYAHIFIEIPKNLNTKTRLKKDQLSVLRTFHYVLRNNSSEDIETLSKIRDILPEYYPLYRELTNTFEHAFSPLPHPPSLLNTLNFPKKDQINVQDAFDVLDLIRGWQENSAQGHLLITQPKDASFTDWKIVLEMDRAQHLWKDEILPILSDLKQKKWVKLESLQIQDKNLAFLVRTKGSLTLLWNNWKKIPVEGLSAELCQEIYEQIKDAQESFYRFWKDSENSSSRPLQWLIFQNQHILSGVYQLLLNIQRNIKMINSSFNMINSPNLKNTKQSQANAGDLIFTLIQLEELIDLPTRKVSKIRQWQVEYSQFLKQEKSVEALKMLETIDPAHPLKHWMEEFMRRNNLFLKTNLDDDW